MVGTSEYFAVYDLVSRTMEDDGIETRKLSELRLIHSQLAELSAVAMTKMTEVEKLLLAHGDQTAG